jgi:branched-subunit amino acid transport protein AzlD
LDQRTTKEKIFKGLKLSVPVLMGIVIFLNPFPYSTATKEIGFYGSVLIVLILACFRKLKFSFKSPLTIPFALFVLWVSIGLFFALDKENSFHDYQTHLLKYMAFYYIVINFFHSRERLASLAWVIIISGALFSIGDIVYFYGLLGNALSTKLVTGIPEVAVNWVGIIAVPAAAFSLHVLMTKNRSRLQASLAAVSLFATFAICILTQARSNVLALFLAIIILCFRNKKVMIVGLGILLIFTTMTSLKDRLTEKDTVLRRLSIHYLNSEIIKDYPVMGIGFGMEAYSSGKYIDLEAYSQRVPEKYRSLSIYSDPHSWPFSIAIRTGLVGLALFLYILFVSFRVSWITIRQGRDEPWGRPLVASFIAILVIGFFEPFFSHVPEVVFYTLLAMMTIVWKSGKERMPS